MGISVLRTTGRLFVPVAAAVLLAGVSLEAGAAGSNGVIRLQLGKAGVADGFYLDKADGSPSGHFQQFSVKQKCIVDTGNWTLDALPTGPGQLVNVAPNGPSGTSNPQAGLLSGSLGVYDNSKGVSCSRMTASIEEGLYIETLIGGFDFLELDMELKGNAIFELVIVGGKTYELRSGTNRIPGGYEGVADPSHLVVNCAGSSDSGPDSGPNDNCRWRINDVGTAFYLYPTEGEGSLEGGGDYSGLVGDFDTKIYLTSLIDVGNLGCDKTNNKTAEVFSNDPATPAASCQVTRINTNNIKSGTCTQLIPYRLETFTADNLCKLDKTEDVKDPLAGSLRVTFKKEPRTSWDVSQTEVTFTGQLNGTKLLANRCAGSVVNDPNGLRTIAQVADTSCLPGTSGCVGSALVTKLKGSVVGNDFVAGDGGSAFLSDVNDEVPGNGYIDWACVLDHSEIYVGDGSPSTPAANDEEQQISQTMLFWGDVGWNRF